MDNTQCDKGFTINVNAGGNQVAQTITNTYEGPVYCGSSTQKKVAVDDQQVARGIEACSSLFWGSSSWAVVFCVLRDYFSGSPNVSEFERHVEELPLVNRPDYDCPPSTVQKALQNNPYMRLHVDKWAENGGAKRAIVFAGQLKKEIETPL